MFPRRGQVSLLSIIIITVIVFSRLHLGVEVQVHCKVRRDGSNADLTCQIPSHLDIVQVTWQKRTGNSYDTLVTHSKRFGVKISRPYENRLSVLSTKDQGTSSIALSQLEKEDDACFTAIFNIYPDGALKGEVCLQKLRGIKEVICKGTADFSVSLSPPQIITKHSDQDSTINIGRWINVSISPECKFELRKETRGKRSVKDEDEIFTIECNTSGTQRPTISWTNEGQPISKEEKENITGDLITVTSKRDHSLSTLPKEKTISCHVSYKKDDGIASAQREDPHIDKNQEILKVVISLSVLAVILIVVIIIGVMYYFLKCRKPSDSPKKDKAEKGFLSPSKDNILWTPATEIKQRKGSTVKKNKENNQQNKLNSSYTLINTDEVKVTNGTPRSEMKQTKSPGQKKERRTAKKLFA